MSKQEENELLINKIEFSFSIGLGITILAIFAFGILYLIFEDRKVILKIKIIYIYISKASRVHKCEIFSQ